VAASVAIALAFAAAGPPATGIAAPPRNARPCDGAVKIGLFVAASGAQADESRELRRGAEIAVQQCADRRLRCALVAAEGMGQWTAGPGELVRLVYADDVDVVLGAADGRTAHLAEQVAARAKGRLLFLTPWASDPSLTQIRVPWFFALAPDDRRQAEVLLAVMAGRFREVAALVAESQYDFRTAWEAVGKVMASRGGPHLREIAVPGETADIDDLVAQVRATGAGAVLFLAPPKVAARAARGLREAGIAAAFFGPLRLATPAFLDAAGTAAEDMVFAAPPEREDSNADGFGARYRRAHQGEPSAVAAYGYDGAAVLIEAARSAGCSGGEPLRTALAATRREGATGTIAFDGSGRRAGPAPLARFERGHLRPLQAKPFIEERGAGPYSPVREESIPAAPRTR